MAENPGGKDKDRFPIANKILADATQIQPSDDSASPLIRAVFANPLGCDALSSGWAPELLEELRRMRRWPGGFAVHQIKQRADDAMRRMQNLEQQVMRGGNLDQADQVWRDRRDAVIRRCREISEIGRVDSV